MVAWVVGQVALAASSWALIARLLPNAKPSERIASAALGAVATPIALIALLSVFGAITRTAVAGSTVLACLAGLFLARRSGRTRARSDLRSGVAALRALATSSAAAPAALGLIALVLAAWAALILPIWAWDALGYHLPIVWDAIEEHRLREVPTHGWYINVYPRAGEMYFTWCRSLLGDDRLLDLAEAPFGLAACAGIAALARRAGATPARALGYAAAFLAVPVVALQIPTAYVDLIYACLLVFAVLYVTAPLTIENSVSFGIATGLLLACKPTAPPLVALLLLGHAARAARRRCWGLAALPLGLAPAIGAWSYVHNLLEYKNPLWPVAVSLGPIHVSGLNPMGPMLVQGLPQSLNRGWLYRVAISLVADPELYVYDMRYGGFWPLVPFFLLPLGLVSLARGYRQPGRLAAGLLSLLAIASPMAHWLRFSLAFPAGLLALTAALVEGFGPWPRRLSDLALAGLAALGLVRAWPGFTGNGYDLWQVAHGAAFAGLDAREAEFTALKARLEPGEAAAYDVAFATPGRLYREDGKTRVVYLDPKRVAPSELLGWTERERVRLLAVADHGPYRNVVVSDPRHFTPVLSCPLDPCHVYQVRRTASEEQAQALTPTTELLVVAPHPDDEILMTAGVLLRAQRAGQQPRVVIVTNGDYDCVTDGIRRQGESVRALNVLGLSEDSVQFLGYPDGHLAELGSTPLPPVRRLVNGRCELRTGTYGARGRGGGDAHWARTGEAGEYTAESAVADLAAILAELRPRHVFVSHPLDEHPDHAATYALVRRAIERQPWAPHLHRALVHIGGCWPNQSRISHPCPDIVIDPAAPEPELPEPFTDYRPRERVVVPLEMQNRTLSANLKAQALLAHATQLGRAGLESYLAAFIRGDESFFPEELVLDSRARWVRPSSTAGQVRADGDWQIEDCSRTRSRSIEQMAPLRFELATSAIRSRARAELLSSSAGSYELVFERAPLAVTLFRNASGRAPLRLEIWPLPHDAGHGAAFELSVEPRPEDGEIAELTLRLNGEFIGQAVDVRPLVRGSSLRLSGFETGTRLDARALPAQ